MSNWNAFLHNVNIFSDDFIHLYLPKCINPHEWLLLSVACDLFVNIFNYFFFFKEAKFIDIISLIPRPRPPCVAALQASLVETWEWDYKHYVYLWTILGQIMCGSSTVSLQDEEIVGAFQIIGVLYHIWTMTELSRVWGWTHVPD